MVHGYLDICRAIWAIYFAGKMRFQKGAPSGSASPDSAPVQETASETPAPNPENDGTIIIDWSSRKFEGVKIVTGTGSPEIGAAVDPFKADVKKWRLKQTPVLFTYDKLTISEDINTSPPATARKPKDGRTFVAWDTTLSD